MKKPMFRSPLYRKADRYDPHRCVVEKAVAIPHTAFEQMRLHPIQDNTYIKEYKDTRMKPTDIWTNHPDPRFNPPCHNEDPCHVAAPRGSKTGTQGLKNSMERSIIPDALCEHIVDICESPINPQ